MHGMENIRYVAAATADVLLPRSCAVCGRRLTVRERFICIGCMEDIPYTYNWTMRYHPTADRFNMAIQQDLAGYEPYSYVANLFFYDDGNGYRHICHRLKYQGDIGIGRHFGKELGLRLSAAPHFRDVDAVVPVPLHWKRLWKRGYNQASVIGKEVARVLGVRFCPGLLARKKETVSQTSLDDRRKHENVKDAFAVPDMAVAEGRIRDRGFFRNTGRSGDEVRHIIIVDDVFTSGATTAACHKALRQLFPAPVRISAATLAAVDEDF